MSALQTRLDQIHTEFESSQPAAVLEIMHRANDDLVASGQHERAAGAGDEFPDFALENTDKETISSQDFLARGPLIINFFRGFW